MWYKLTWIYIWQDKVRPSKREPWANTIGYRPFNWDANDYSWNGHDLSNTGTVTYTTQLANGNYVATRTWAVEWVMSCFYTQFNYTNVPLTMVGWCRTSWNWTSSYYWPNKWMLWYSDNNSNGNVIKTAHGTNGYYIYVDSSPQSWVDAESSSSYADGNRHCMIWVFDTTWVALYVDDMTTPVCSGSTATTGTTCTWTLMIWGMSNQSYYSFNWDMSEFIMEDKARTEQERTQYFNLMKWNYWIS